MCFFPPVLFVLLSIFALGVAAIDSVAPVTARDNSQFITIGSAGLLTSQFLKNGNPFRFNGTNAYWLSTLENDTDIDTTLHDIASSGIQVVRIWAFNDVTEIPDEGVWFQLIANGTTSINTGPNGLQRLDKVVSAAENEGVFLIMSLTNNWNPRPLTDKTSLVAVERHARRDITIGTGNNLSRNTLSNDYGGMDAYVREFGVTKRHDEFYQNETIINIFQNYTSQVIKRYINSTAILSWEIANDPRCNSSIPATSSCNTNTVTAWHFTIANHIKAIDPNHLISSGVQGFQCPDCPKLFIPAGQQSKRRDMHERGKGMSVRASGGWVATRQTPNPSDVLLGPTMDGSFGVDSEDIMFIGNISFGSFQLFPDQNTYGQTFSNVSAFNDTVQMGLAWISSNVQFTDTAKKPMVLTGFGLVTQDNSGSFIPFNGTIAPFNSTDPAALASEPFGVTAAEQEDAYAQWISASFTAGVAGVVQYQWGEGDLTIQQGTNIEIDGGLPNGTATSPNDGYQILSRNIQGTSTTPVNPNISSKSFLRHTGAAAGVFTTVGLLGLAVLITVYLKLIRRRQFIQLGRLRDSEGEWQIQGGRRYEMEITPFSDPADSRGFVDLILEGQQGSSAVIAPTQTHRSRQASMEFPAPPPSSSGSPPPYRTNASATSEAAAPEVLHVVQPTTHASGNDAKIEPRR